MWFSMKSLILEGAPAFWSFLYSILFLMNGIKNIPIDTKNIIVLE